MKRGFIKIVFNNTLHQIVDIGVENTSQLHEAPTWAGLERWWCMYDSENTYVLALNDGSRLMLNRSQITSITLNPVSPAVDLDGPYK